MAPPLTAFHGKLAEIARGYEALQVRCLDLENEVLRLRQGEIETPQVPSGFAQSADGNGHLRDVAKQQEEASALRPSDEHGQLREAAKKDERTIINEVSSDPRQMPVARTPPVTERDGEQDGELAEEELKAELKANSSAATQNHVLQPSAPKEAGVLKTADSKQVLEKILSVVSELQSIAASFSSSKSSSAETGAVRRASVLCMTKLMQEKQEKHLEFDEGIGQEQKLESKMDDGRPHSLNHWRHLYERVLSGESARQWKIDPVWETNFQIRKDPSMGGLQRSRSHGLKEAFGLLRPKLDRMGTNMASIPQRVSSGISNQLEAAREARTGGTCLPPFHPNDKRKLIWDVISLLLVFYDFVTLPMGVFYAGEPFEWLKFAMAGFWTSDILVSLSTGYYTEHGHVEMDPSRIAKNYFKAQFPIDCPLTVLDWSLLAISLNFNSQFSGVLRLLFRCTRGLRLLRLRKGMQRMEMIAENMSTEYVIVAIDILKMMVCVFLASHYTACCWYGLSQVEINDLMNPTTWADAQLSDQYFGNSGYAYATSLHWALTQFTPASMEVVPTNTAERVFACIVILTALVVFSSFVSSITQAMTYLRQINHQKTLQECTIRRFLKQRNISPVTSVQVWRFVKRHKLTDSSFVREQDVGPLKQLPSHLRLQIRMQVYVPLLAAHPLFGLQEKCEENFTVILCSRCLREINVGAGMEAFAPEEEIQDMMFLMRGQLEYISTEDESIYLKPGEWAVELALWANHVRLPGSMMGCDRGAEVVLLNATAFRKSARKYCTSFSFLSDYAVNFVNLFKDVLRRGVPALDAGTHVPSTDGPSALQRLSGRHSGRNSKVGSNYNLKSIETVMLFAQCILFNSWELVDHIIADIITDHPLHSMMYRKLRNQGAHRYKFA